MRLFQKLGKLKI
ncbi:unnamed protein product [Acanthoscelides obtectus]|uniref:Uncharacterized protein n=1 Tax=Acanthoscelides obtectus TaxID=200917 RepID=A0A9P0NS32_ACAOB|nr:unnamed protein product [Acanthoscelides obtectus]CAK1661516.1 hypothetical protein AOBTE_LOCUS22659 [Acanthoscelides obtectus]